MPNIFRVTTVALMYGQEFQNVFHLTGPSADPAELSTIADEIALNWLQQIRAQQTAALVYTGVKVRLLESQFPTFVKTVNFAGLNGFDDELSTVLGFILRLRSAEIGKRGRGRLYIGGVMKGWTKNGLVIDSQLTAWGVRITNLLARYGPQGSTTYRLVICPSKAPFSTRAVTTMQLAPKLGTQRRRNIGVGI